MEMNSFACSHCGSALNPTDTPYGMLYICSSLQCGIGVRNPKTIVTVAAKPARRTLLQQANDVSEADLVTSAKKAFEKCGFIVLLVSQRGGKNSGTTVGCPDMFVSKPGVNRWVAFEWKATEHDKPSASQQKLIDKHVSTCVWDIDQAMRILDYALGGAPYRIVPRG